MTITPSAAAAAASSLNMSNVDDKNWYIISALVEDKPGVLFRITNLFRARNFNIESITVGSTENADLSRMTITTESDEKTLDQLVKQLRKLIDVVEVKVLDIGKETITVELTGTPDKIEAFKNLVDHFGIIQLARTGVLALPRGAYC